MRRCSGFDDQFTRPIWQVSVVKQTGTKAWRLAWERSEVATLLSRVNQVR